MRSGRGDGTVRRQPRPASSMMVQPERPLPRARGGFVEEGPDGFRRVLESLVGGIDHRLCDDGDDRPGEPAPGEFVGQRLDEHVADSALGVGDGVVDGHRVHLVTRTVPTGAG